MITVTEFIEKVDAIMGQKNMDNKNANLLCHLYAMVKTLVGRKKRNMDKWYYETKKWYYEVKEEKGE